MRPDREPDDWDRALFRELCLAARPIPGWRVLSEPELHRRMTCSGIPADLVIGLVGRKPAIEGGRKVLRIARAEEFALRHAVGRADWFAFQGRAAFVRGALGAADDVLVLPADAQYLCGCGYEFPEELGAYGCPNCEGDDGPATLQDIPEGAAHGQ